MKSSLVLIILALVFLGCERTTKFRASADDLCLTNMEQIWFVLQRDLDSGAYYASNLATFAQICTNKEIFVCPSTGHQAGSLKTVMEWTDYIYFANEEEASRNLPVLICPPENHNGKFGHVSWNGGYEERLPPEQIRSLIELPWSRMTNYVDPLTMYYIKSNTFVQIPPKLRSHYPKAYNPTNAGPSSSL
jgi:hypothetical protein